MCGCALHQQSDTAMVQAAPDAVTFKVDDMTCGHCAGTITKAIEAGLPGTQVHADPATKLVTVHGATDRTSIESLIARAGYTPTAASA